MQRESGGRHHVGAERIRAIDPLRGFATSLFTYVTQFVFVHSLPAICGLRGRLDLAGVLGLAAASVAATWVLAYAYGRARGWIVADDYRAMHALGARSPLRPEAP